MNINGGNFKEYPTEEMMKGFKKGLKGTVHRYIHLHTGKILTIMEVYHKINKSEFKMGDVGVEGESVRFNY